MVRRSGVLMSVCSLWGKYGCGGFDGSAIEFIDFLSDCGFSCWQTLPLCVPDEFNSPYKSYSAFSLNPYFIDLESLYERDLITAAELEGEMQKAPYLCEYERLKDKRVELLIRASQRVKDKTEIERIIKKFPYLDELAMFMAKKKANDGKPFYMWTTEAYDENIFFAWRFIQAELISKWFEIKEYANKKGISIIGDIPMYVSYDSADVWFHRDCFKLDAKGVPTEVAGVPPDYFSPEGQLWGNPLYDWEKMRLDGYKWWCDRIKYALTLFDGIRIDHFRGFEAYYSIPYGSENAKNGSWNKGAGVHFIDNIKKLCTSRLIIAEDLGEITEEVIKLVRHSGFASTRVFQFGFIEDNDSTHMPHNYIENCVAYTGTHDNNTLLGYLFDVGGNLRSKIFDYCGYDGVSIERGVESIIKTMLASHAGTVVFPIQDLLCYGSDTRMNCPGRAEGNWAYRVTREQLFSLDRQKYRHLNKLYNRIQSIE